ncbi:phosphatase PAP2 family protein [Slackia heliotrinireducens]|jgi:undecaprenyl-diphosphatase|uniref:PAP2 superfamily protein n=1 Tax=Slackia heliotrinireducens (strain ATCC 29202 / DSM 20476 / NCTC 11029 / RHS 1) TaxID=471855 RepID=C7N6J2_SLAHD|nr:phosphatase PAP2 family protein [Slackia heliotrinireducens]ACV22527.1 PAP2 superfamily protein [Slackia heliotrinireducens DSM 20476]VEH00969.1 Putative undecaprenyl-diphosphatase ybjG [Slackia heliotrinireducens]
MYDAILATDLSILHAIKSTLTCMPLDWFLGFLTLQGEIGAIGIVCGLALLFKKEYRIYGVMLLLAMLFASALTSGLIKNLVQRPRPFIVDPALLNTFVRLPSSTSFPSTHSSVSFAAATVICLMPLKHRWIKVAAVVLAAATAFSRLYFGVHFPTDVLFGTLFGIASGFAAWALVNAVEQRRQRLRSGNGPTVPPDES